MNIPFSPPYIDQDVLDEVMNTLQSGWITTGPKVKALEQLSAEIAGVQPVSYTHLDVYKRQVIEVTIL